MVVSREEAQRWGGVVGDVERLGIEPSTFLQKLAGLLNKDYHVGAQVVCILAQSSSIDEYLDQTHTLLLERVLGAPESVFQPCLWQLYQVWREAKMDLLPRSQRADDPVVLGYIGELQELRTSLHEKHKFSDPRDLEKDGIDSIEYDILWQIGFLAETKTFTGEDSVQEVAAAPLEKQEEILRFLLGVLDRMDRHARSRDMVREKAEETILILAGRFEEGVLHKLIADPSLLNHRDILDRAFLKHCGRSRMVDFWVAGHPLPPTSEESAVEQ